MVVNPVSKSQSHPNLLFHDLEPSSTDSLSWLQVDPVDGKHRATFPASGPSRSVIGGVLWKSLITGRLPILPQKVDWPALVREHADILSGVSVDQLREFHSALTSIVILDENLDDRASAFLQECNGHLLPLSTNIIQELTRQAPGSFTCFVADFNDNMAFQLREGRGIPVSHPDVSILQDTLQTTLKSSRPMEIQASFLRTEYRTIAQPPHVDFPWKVLEERGHQLWLSFFGLTLEGMILQVWPGAGRGCQGRLVFVPLGQLLILPSDTIHGGGFRTRPIFDAGSVGNLRYHLYLAADGGSLPQFANNTYTQPQDKAHELGEICLPALHLEDGDSLLMELLFE